MKCYKCKKKVNDNKIIRIRFAQYSPGDVIGTRGKVLGIKVKNMCPECYGALNIAKQKN